MMSSEDSSIRSPIQQPGRLARTLRKLFGKRATITAIDAIGNQFRLVTLEGSALRGIAWTPGQKLQVAMASSLAARTYTPIEWDAASGRTRILGYAHGEGPGSKWLLDARIGDECDFFGPSASLAAPRSHGQIVVCGDETSIGVAWALSTQAPFDSQQCLLEVNNAALAHEVLARMDCHGAELFERAENDVHLEAIERRLPALIKAGATFLLTGKASTIRRLHRALQALDVPSSRLIAKPYWAPGRAGLD